jgi:hypothetical protein
MCVVLLKFFSSAAAREFNHSGSALIIMKLKISLERKENRLDEVEHKTFFKITETPRSYQRELFTFGQPLAFNFFIIA